MGVRESVPRRAMPSITHHDAFKLSAFVVATLVLGALLAPPLYWGGKHVVAEGWLEGGWLDSIHGSMDRATFARYFNRAMLVAAVIFIYPTIRWIGWKRGKEAIVLERNPHRWRHLAAGFGVAAGTLLLLGWLYLLVGFYRPHDKADPLLEILGGATMSAFGVAFLEEFFFRGALLGLVLRTARPWRALLFVTAFFAIVHFLKPPPKLVYPEIEWHSGFWMIGKIFGQFGNPVFFAAEFATLFAVGWILGYTRLITRSLFLAIGLHAGWVFGIKTYSALTRKDMALAEMLPWAGQDLKIGLGSLITVAVTGVGLFVVLRRLYPDRRVSETTSVSAGEDASPREEPSTGTD